MSTFRESNHFSSPKVVIPKGRGSKILLATSTVAYLLYYLFFTGVIKADNVLGYSIQGINMKLVEIASGTYSGPAFQIIGGSSIMTIRLIPLLIALALSFAFGLNIALLWGLYNLGGLRACLYAGGAGGFGAIMANLASFSYLCCGWTASLVLIGSTFLAGLSMFISVGATLLLAFNAFILGRRYAILVR